MRPQSSFRGGTAQGGMFLDGGCWTETLPQDEHCQLFRDTDWSKTSLGSISDWDIGLRFYTSMLFADNRPACIYWGPEERIAIYNQEFSVILGAVHPKLMGMSFYEGFPEIAEAVRPVFQAGIKTRRTVQLPDSCLYVERNGFLEETYWTNQFIPIPGQNGEIQGVYNTAIESTQQVVHERQRRVKDQIVTLAAHAVSEMLVMVMEALRGNPNDVCMALLYVYEESDLYGDDDLRLGGSIGVSEGHCLAPRTAHLRTGNGGLVPYFRQAKASGKPVVLSESDGTLADVTALLDGVTWCGHGEVPRHISIQELRSNLGDSLGFYVQAMNPRRPYDDNYRKSVADLTRAIEARWLSSLSTEQAKLREQALERRATDSENRMRLMARHAPIGFVQIDMDGRIEWANDQFYDITGHDRTTPEMSEFFKCFAPEERERAAGALGALQHEGMDRDVNEYRLNRRWQPPGLDQEETSAWILTLGLPLLSDDGQVKLVMGFISDISHQKWAEHVESRNAARALQAKRQQEEFIDTTSHEMRNPLTAMTQLADGIAGCLKGATASSNEDYRALIRENIEAASTILACAAHQKRVIDDVLILSRLESEMLSITPVPEKQSKVVADVTRMFSAECLVNDISIHVVRDPANERLTTQNVLVDTSRLAQILINLLSNATKFVANHAIRKVTVVYGASLEHPPVLDTPHSMKWIDGESELHTNIALPTLGKDEERVYLYFCVSDSGPGMTDDEMSRLFKRFSQASSRTHIQYGGSGIGLYVCRQLAEKQGGRIAVGSRTGEGSSFGFYIETRLTDGASPNTSNGSSLPGPGRPGLERDQGRSRSEDALATAESLSRRGSKTIPKERGFDVLLVEDVSAHLLRLVHTLTSSEEPYQPTRPDETTSLSKVHSHDRQPWTGMSRPAREVRLLA